MLAKSVIGKKNIVSSKVGRHTVRPVQHPHFNEHKFFPVADIQGIAAGLHNIEVPAAVSPSWPSRLLMAFAVQ